MLDLLFVYGTLRSEFENPYAQMLRSDAELVGRAIVRGAIYRVEHYPAYRPESQGEVHGELYRLNDPETMFEALDDYEGSDFERVAVNTLAHGQAWIYQYRQTPAKGARIVSGEFRAP